MGGATPPDEAELIALVGTELPPGRHRIDPVVSRMLDSAVRAPTPPGPAPEPHPIWSFVVAQTGIGLDVGGLLGLFGSSGADGPMLGECDLDMLRPFETGVEYAVTGRVTRAVRKKGRALGVFDLVTVEYEVHAPDSLLVARCRETFVLPRREAAQA
ncbi:hypothetical protein [Streptomyces muensis]|uniref:N-terminal of MaoC-like dehydratase domain-containing protein n=1 Tax=Streptomyces muensis TaxID=1077944 RepID=A0A9X1PT71_STRM4|nr:hypothetical protein [Streptomyces muensis]MCF1592576.1 hypothetical protein [Streptomyces muensis]